MQVKFQGTLSNFQVKPNKDVGRVAVITITTEVTNSIAALQMQVGNEISVEIDKFEWPAARKKDGEQIGMQDYLAVECAVCGHPRGHHQLDPVACLGMDGMCSCDKFVSREEAEQGPTEGATVLDEFAPEEICKYCGHTYELHREGGCSSAIESDEEPVEGEEVKEYFCACPDFVRMDPDLVEGEEAAGDDLPTGDLCTSCGHLRANHEPLVGCMADGGDGKVCECMSQYTAEAEEAEEYPVEGDDNALAGPATLETKGKGRGKKASAPVEAQVA